MHWQQLASPAAYAPRRSVGHLAAGEQPGQPQGPAGRTEPGRLDGGGNTRRGGRGEGKGGVETRAAASDGTEGHARDASLEQCLVECIRRLLEDAEAGIVEKRSALCTGLVTFWWLLTCWRGG